ncbi:pentatricopeptide repeat-containing protein-like [Iris pallida]|uniref:Pentatricopeptide repeat-containing protein-like n=1 Tax=Iris pallida TaxID=29817 RepID=A0AAX6HLM3_IRIPA|nr:pentatricopeptide repeat-containing protein-like [Iris pallida]
MEVVLSSSLDQQLHAQLIKNELPSLLSSAALLRSHSISRQIHALTVKTVSSSCNLLHNSLLRLYSTSSQFPSALKLFDTIPHSHRDAVTWTLLISAATESNRPSLALRIFDSMQAQHGGVLPNAATLLSVLRACAVIGFPSAVRRAHVVATRLGLASEPSVLTALIDAYSKCGRLNLAERLFNKHIASTNETDVFSTTAFIAGLASHGRSAEALRLFYELVESGAKPDGRTVTAALSACRSSGMVCEGYRIFNSCTSKFGVERRIEHYGCMVDLLARAGRLDEAEEFVRGMPFEPDPVMWRNLVWASNLHKDIDRAKRLIKERPSLLLEEDGGSYVLIGNVYASAENWEEKARIRRRMTTGKVPGCSRIEVKGIVHEFEAGDSKHPEGASIYRKWEEVMEELRTEGHVPRLSEVLLDVEDEGEKALQLQHHSEKLAVAFGLISTRPGEDILVVKNLRACEDCHDAMKLLSRIHGRKIVIRDRIRFHHFSNGACSCRDYW